MLSKFTVLRVLSKHDQEIVANDLFSRMLKRENDDLKRTEQLISLLTTQDKKDCSWKLIAKFVF